MLALALLLLPAFVPEHERCAPQLPAEMIHDYVNQDVSGPIQADEAIFLHSLIRTTGARRVLELGGLAGYSASVFLHAVSCHASRRVYTVDLHPVRSQGPHHTTLQKNAITLTMADVDHEKIDVVFLDCHAFYATKHTVENMIQNQMLSENALLVLHDTGQHKRKARQHSWSRDYVHQPVERVFAQYMGQRGWQRVSFHDDFRPRGGRHGITVLQRPANLTVICDDQWKQFYDIRTAECKEIQAA